jgi:hypothetical protein
MSINDRAAGAVMGALIGDALGVGPCASIDGERSLPIRDLLQDSGNSQWWGGRSVARRQPT